MEKKIKIYKIRVLIAAAIVSMLTGLLITIYNYRLTNIVVQEQVQSNLDLFTGRLLTEINHLESILETTIQIMNDEHIAIAKAIDYILADASEEDLTPESLQRLAEPLDILELNLVNSQGILTHSNVPELIGFNYNDYEATRIYIALATRTLTEIREMPRQSVLDDEEYGDTNHYAGVSRTGGGFIQVGFDARIIWRLYDEFSTAQAIRDIDIGKGGFGMVLTDGIITTHSDSAMLGVDVSEEDWYKIVRHGYDFTWLEIDGRNYFVGYLNDNNHTIIGLVSETEFYKESRELLARSLTLIFIATAVILPLIYMLTGVLLQGLKKSGAFKTTGEDATDGRR